VSDLQCAATLLLARHAETEHESPAGREHALALGRSLVDRRLAVIYCSALARAVQTAEIVAEVTGAGVVVREDLREVGGESGAEIRARVERELSSIADQHRGETVLVVMHTGTLQTGVPPLVGLGDEFAASHPVPHCAVVEVAVDGDGWVLRSWPGED
jgi:broad specificity phosphatase PhoE